MAESGQNNTFGGLGEAGSVFSDSLKAQTETIEKIAHYGDEATQALGKIARITVTLHSIDSRITVTLHSIDSRRALL